MARPKEFDVDDAITRAMHLFRAQGFEATSMKDLESATGLKPGSLYNAFGSKEALFLAALDHYNTTVVQYRIDRYLKGGDAPLDALRALFVSTLHEPGGSRFGCLLTNSAVECSRVTPAVAAKVAAGFALLEAAFARQVRLAQAIGELPAGASTKRIALQLLHAYQGLLVLVRFGREPRELRHLIDDLISNIVKGAADD